MKFKKKRYLFQSSKEFNSPSPVGEISHGWNNMGLYNLECDGRGTSCGRNSVNSLAHLCHQPVTDEQHCGEVASPRYQVHRFKKRQRV